MRAITDIESREQLAKVVSPRFLPYLKDSFRLDSGGWRLAFDPEEMLESQRCLIGEYWSDWLASSCPIADLRSRESGNTCSTVEGYGRKKAEYGFFGNCPADMWFISTAMHLLLMLCASF